MAIYNGYPAYPAMMPYQQPYQPYQQAPQTQQPRTVEVVPVDSEDQITSWQVPMGTTVEFVSRDDSFVAFKSVEMSGQSTTTFYDKRPPAAPKPKAEYVTREELEQRLAAWKEEHHEPV